MIREGVLENVSSILGLHTVHRYGVGTFASRPGKFLAGCGSFKASITGKGGHAASPHDSVDPILAASACVISLQGIVSRETDPLDSQVVSVTMIEGGRAFNIIPELVTIAGTFRAFGRKSFDQLRTRIEEVCTLCCVFSCNSLQITVNQYTMVIVFFTNIHTFLLWDQLKKS